MPDRASTPVAIPHPLDGLPLGVDALAPEGALGQGHVPDHVLGDHLEAVALGDGLGRAVDLLGGDDAHAPRHRRQDLRPAGVVEHLVELLPVVHGAQRRAHDDGQGRHVREGQFVGRLVHVEPVLLGDVLVGHALVLLGVEPRFLDEGTGAGEHPRTGEVDYLLHPHGAFAEDHGHPVALPRGDDDAVVVAVLLGEFEHGVGGLGWVGELDPVQEVAVVYHALRPP
jgi:hypothetical protein